MKVLIRNPKTGTFFKAQDDWTLETREARDFLDRETAMTTAQDLGFPEVEIILADTNGNVMAGTLFRLQP